MRDSKKSTPDGFLNVWKPPGWTSHDVVGLIRRLTGTRRVGHAGTLDPAATGVLVVAVGRATRLLDYADTSDKVYRAEVAFGSATTTDDAEGAVLFTRDSSGLTLQTIVGALSRFLGEIDQVPPQYSAVKIGGRKAYEIARKGGEAALAARKVTIKGLVVVGWEAASSGEPPESGATPATSAKMTLLIRCSKGTYIRSLARDLGEVVGTGAHLASLSRLSAGSFRGADSFDVDGLTLAAEKGELEGLIQTADVAVRHLPRLDLSVEEAGHMVAGRAWEAGDGETVRRGDRETARVYGPGGAFLGLARMVEGKWQPKVVFPDSVPAGLQPPLEILR